MITQKQQNIGGLLTDIKNRQAGEMERDGKIISWEERKQIFLLPFEEGRNIVKYCIAPDAVEKVLSNLENVHWGCLVELELNSKRDVISVTVVSDVLKDFYESNVN